MPPRILTREDALLLTLRTEMQRRGDAERSKSQQAYMKSTMPYHGLTNAQVVAVCREAFATIPLQSAAEWQRSVLGLWRGTQFREERYAAIRLSGVRSARAWQTLEALPMYEEIIVDGAWWDYVDDVASHRVGVLLRAFPAPMRKQMLAWSRCGNLWKQRTSIICQLTFKKETDLKLLYACIEPSLDSKEFFLRKAIGWALRQYAWTDPAPVIRYVEDHADRLSGLSRREALKNVLKAGLIARAP